MPTTGLEVMRRVETFLVACKSCQLSLTSLIGNTSWSSQSPPNPLTRDMSQFLMRCVFDATRRKPFLVAYDMFSTRGGGGNPSLSLVWSMRCVFNAMCFGVTRRGNPSLSHMTCFWHNKEEKTLPHHSCCVFNTTRRGKPSLVACVMCFQCNEGATLSCC